MVWGSCLAVLDSFFVVFGGFLAVFGGFWPVFCGLGCFSFGSNNLCTCASLRA